MAWFKKKDKEEDIGICKDCVYRDTNIFDKPMCCITVQDITGDLPNTCEMKRVGGCATCQNRISDIHECRGIKVCQCAVSDYDNNLVKVRKQCRKYAYIEGDEQEKGWGGNTWARLSTADR